MIVLDGSAAVNMVRRTPEGGALFNLMQPEEKVIAPSLYQAEITNAFWKYARAGIETPEVARLHIKEALDLVCEYKDMGPMCLEALSEGTRLGHSAYDLYYLILARREGATLFTLDAKLVRLATECGVDCVCPFEWEE